MTLIPAAALAIVALAGTSLGVLTAKAINRDLPDGFDQFGSGVQSGQTLTAEQWVACLDADDIDSLKSVYVWDNNLKVWYHYFNPEHPDHSGLPDYVNIIGGITEIRRSTAVTVLATDPIPDARFAETVTEANNCLAD